MQVSAALSAFLLCFFFLKETFFFLKASLFGPIFLSHDVSSDKKRSDLLTKVQHQNRTGFTPLFARRTKSKDTAAETLEHEAVDLREIMNLGVTVVQMLLVHFREIWHRFNTARPVRLFFFVSFFF